MWEVADLHISMVSTSVRRSLQRLVHSDAFLAYAKPDASSTTIHKIIFIIPAGVQEAEGREGSESSCLQGRKKEKPLRFNSATAGQWEGYKSMGEGIMI